MDGEFLLDDRVLVEDPSLLSPGLLEAARWVAMARPVGIATFALNHAAVGFDTRGWHLTNLAIHLAAVVLAFLLARLTLERAGFSRPQGPALAAAALFALHPLQTESVAYLSQRFESLACALYLLALLLLLARDRAGGWRRWALLGGATVVHVLALGTKPIAATLPAAWLLHASVVPAPAEEGLPAWRRAARRAPAALPLFAASALAAALALRAAAGSADAGWSVPGLSPTEYLATQVRVIPTYLRLLAWPAGQCADWFFPASHGFLEPAVLGGAALLAATCAAAVFLVARFGNVGGEGAAAARVASFGILFFLLALAPSSLIPLRDPLAEHRVYLASFGIFLAVSTGATVALRRLVPARAFAIGAALALLALSALGVATARRNEVWTTPLAFWTDAAAKSPEKARAHMSLGAALLLRGHHAQALAALRRAQDRRGDGTISGEALLENLVTVLATLGRTEEARSEISRALAARAADPTALSLLAQIDYVSSRRDAAERAARAALAADPRQWRALKFLGMIAYDRGDLDGARRALRAAAATGVTDAQVYWTLGAAEERAGDILAACAAYRTGAGQPSISHFTRMVRAEAARLRCP